MTSPDGSFTFPEVVEGAWRLTADKLGYARAERTATVVAGRPADQLEIRLEPAEQPAATPAARSYSAGAGGLYARL